MNHLKLLHDILIANDAEETLRKSVAFLAQVLLETPNGTQCQPRAHIEGCVCKLLNNSDFDTFLRSIKSTIITCYLRYVDQAA